MFGSRRRTLAVIGFVFLFACSGGGSCSCVEPIKGGFPTGERHPNAIQIRATKGAFEYFEMNAKTLLNALIPGMGTFNVPPSCGTNKICCATPAPMCRIDIKPQNLVLDPTTPNALKLALTTQLVTKDKLPVEFDVVLGTAKCFVELDTTKGDQGFTDIDIKADISFPVDATSALTKITAANAVVDHLHGSMLTLTSQPGDFLCTIANIGFIKTFVIDQLKSQLASQISDTVNSATCMKCMAKDDCNSFASDCKGGECVLSDGTTCVQETGLDGRMDVGKMLSSFSPGLQAKMDVLAVLGGYSKADTGLSLGMLGGGVAAPHSPCVPAVAKPVPPMFMPSPSFAGDVIPSTTTGYHLGIGVHRSHLDTLGYSAWDSGALCLKVGTPSVALLTTKTIGVIIPSMDELTHSKDGPMFLAIRPDKPPTFTMGKGTFKDENGKRVIDEPLMKVSVPSFNIDFYAFFDQHYVRLMTLTADLELPISLDVDAMGKIVPVLGELTSAFKNTRVSNSELLSEAPSDLAKTFPMLIGLAGGQIGSALNPIALPAIMGLNIGPKVITSTDPIDGVNQYLAIYADLVPGPTMAKRIGSVVETSARLARLSNPPTAEFAVSAKQTSAPTVTLEVGGTTVEGLPLEFQYMVDDAGWSPFSQSERLEITHPLLWLQGHHTIQVRARAVGRPSSLDGDPAQVGVIIDTIAPTGRLVAEGGTLRIADAFDRVTARESLVWRHRIGQGEPSAWHAIDEIVPLAGVAQKLITAELSDEVGNLGLLDFHGRTTAPADAGCGCSLGAAAPSPAGPAIIVVLAFSLLMLRKKALLLLVLLAGCSRGLGPGDFVNELDEVGRWNSVAAHKGVFHVSAYDTSMGDLVYARITEVGAPIKWQYVDGLDPSAGMGIPEMPRMGFTDPGTDVGTHTSIAVNKDGKVRIAYYDITNNALKFAVGDVLFETHAIDTGPASVPTGLYTALSLDESDRPTVAYMATGISNGKQGFKSELRVAIASTALPKSSTDWTVSVVDTTAISCAGRCATGSACVMAEMVGGMPNGDPAISTCVPVDKAACPSMCGDTQVCIATKCTEILVPPKAIDLTEGTGLFTQAVRTAGGLMLVYYDRNQGDLKLASQQSGGGFKITVIDGNDPNTDVGQFPAAAVADGGTLHVAYVDAINDRLLYKTVTAGAPAMTADVIDDGMRTDGPRPVGSGAALILEGGSPRVVYQDQQRSDLMDARKGAMWTRNAIKQGAPGYGWWPHLVSDGGRTYLGQLIYDRAIQPPMPIGRFDLSAMP
jgi:hypothetical protein